MRAKHLSLIQESALKLSLPCFYKLVLKSIMPRSFLINDKPKVKPERHRTEGQETTMDTEERYGGDSFPLNLPNATSASTDQHLARPQVPVSCLPYSIAKLTGCDEKNSSTTEVANADSVISKVSVDVYQHAEYIKYSNSSQLSGHVSVSPITTSSVAPSHSVPFPGDFRHHPGLPNTSKHPNLATSAHTQNSIHHGDPNSRPHEPQSAPIFPRPPSVPATPHMITSTEYHTAYKSHLASTLTSQGFQRTLNVPMMDSNKFISGKGVTEVSHADPKEELQQRGYYPPRHHLLQNSLQNFAPNFFHSNQQHNFTEQQNPEMSAPDSSGQQVSPQCNRLTSSVFPVPRHVSHPLPPPPPSTQHQTTSAPSHETPIMVGKPSTPDHPTHAASTPLRGSASPSMTRLSVSPAEVPRSSTPAAGRGEAGYDPDLSVVTELDRSSDSGLDSGHQSSDFDGEVEQDEEQIDVVGDGDHEEEEEEEDDDEMEAEEDELDDVDEEGTSEDMTVPHPATPPIARPQPKRSAPLPEPRLEPISPASSSSSLSPGSSVSCSPDFLRFSDPRFWQSTLPSITHHYLPSLAGFSRLPRGLQPDARSRSGGFPPDPRLPAAPHLPVQPGMPAMMRPAHGMGGKHPFLPFPTSIFNGLFASGDMNHPRTSPCSGQSPPVTSMHPSFPMVPRPSMPEHSPPAGGVLPPPPPHHPPGHLAAQKARPPATTLPWLLDIPGFGLGKEGVMDSAPARKANEPPRYQCDACKKSYATFSGLSKHKQFHCESHIKKEFSCKYCDKRYTSLGALKMHIRTHTLPCKCQICGKAFSRPWLLQGHVRTHTGEKPFSCQHCNRAFADRSNLRAHLQTHSDIKKYSCKNCTKTFSRMSLLLKHEENSCPGSRPAIVGTV